MVEEVKEILNNDVEVVIGSPQLSLSLLKCYSELFLNGRKPRVCAKSQRIYYEELKTKGMAKAEILEKVKVRTCVPAFKGLRYSNKVFCHISSELLYDEQAIEYLNNGALKESDFEVLPEGYKKEVKETQKKRGPKKGSKRTPKQAE